MSSTSSVQYVSSVSSVSSKCTSIQPPACAVPELGDCDGLLPVILTPFVGVCRLPSLFMVEFVRKHAGCTLQHVGGAGSVCGVCVGGEGGRCFADVQRMLATTPRHGVPEYTVWCACTFALTTQYSTQFQAASYCSQAKANQYQPRHTTVAYRVAAFHGKRAGRIFGSTHLVRAELKY